MASYMRIDDLNSGAINETQAKAIFEHEKERIKELAFWDKVPELSTKTPYHFNPIAFVGNAKINRCFCGRDFTVDELKNIVKTMRDDLDTIKHYNLFTKSNCKIPSKDKTYERFLCTRQKVESPLTMVS